MDSPHTGSEELAYVRTDKVTVTIKGHILEQKVFAAEYSAGASVFKVYCCKGYELLLNKCANQSIVAGGDSANYGIYVINPLFFEQQRYEIIIESVDSQEVTFWHDNLNIRNKVTRSSRRYNILTGVINFGNEIGLSDLVIQLDGTDYLRLVIEVFPTKISYKEDYQSIVEDITREVYNLIFDFLKKTYLDYQQSDKVNSSPVEFFAIIRKIYQDFIRAVDRVLIQPHHVLETTHEVLARHKVKRIDSRTVRWVEKHPEQTHNVNGEYVVSRALAVRKQITYDTKENRLAKHIIQSTAKKLESFKRHYIRLNRETDKVVETQINDMITGLNRRSNTSFFMDVSALEASFGMSLVYSMAPGYRDIYKYFLMLMRGLSVSGDVFDISIKDLALLYEYWCFIKLNSLMKDRYELISQDIIRVQGNGLYVSLVKGETSSVRYRNPINGESISLSYNPKYSNKSTITQRPDNVLSLEKRGTNVQYEYVFDAKYRINPALPGTDYHNTISAMPGPELDDINTMHRYRDAIVYQHCASPFERLMFGAYVLFPYDNEEEYRQHHFYKSIEKVNIGGLPFLPSAVNLVSGIMDELISESPISAFERAVLPKGTKEKLAMINWSVRDVLVGDLRSREQLVTCLQNMFYHVPEKDIKESNLPIHYVAIYQSERLFGAEAGVRYYGEVTKCLLLQRHEIKEIPSNSDEHYYRLEIKKWLTLPKVIKKKEIRQFRFFTNMFLLEHCSEVDELLLQSAEQYRLYIELKRLADSTTIDDEHSELGLLFFGSLLVFEGSFIRIYRNKKAVAEYAVNEFQRSPNAVFRRMQKDIIGQR